MSRNCKHSLARAVVASLALGITSGAVQAGGLLAVEFDDGNFDPAMMSIIGNPYWPLTPAMGYVRQFTYIGEEEDECVVNKILIESGDTKTDFAAPYENIEAQVVLDREWVVVLGEGDSCDATTAVSDDDLTEVTYDWYAQDIHVNVWYMGEASRDFEDGCPSLDEVALGAPVEDWDSEEQFLECTGGSWEAGQPGQEEGEIIGEAGIVVPGDFPEGGEEIEAGTFYLQEVAEGAQDMAKILRIHASLQVEDGVAPGNYDDCRKVKEWTALEPGSSVEHKWYCMDGPGLVLIEGIGGGTTQQEVLVEVMDTYVGP